MRREELKNTARALFRTGVRAADPAAAVKRALESQPLHLNASGRVFIIAFGKASCAMMKQALQHVPKGQPVKAIAVTNYDNAIDIPDCRVIASGHPLPDQNGIGAGIEVMSLLQSASADDQVLCLISGGGSAILPTPRNGLSLADKIKVNEVLLAGGLDIVQMNRVRQQLSVLKGGGLLDMAHPAQVRSLIISDVVGDDLEAIASGPTTPLNHRSDNKEMLEAMGLWCDLPSSAQALLETPKPVSKYAAQNELICTNMQSLQAIARGASDWSPHVVQKPMVGDVEQAAQNILHHIQSLPNTERQLIIWGGETTVKITGTGRGGRNQELAVRFARIASGLKGDWVFLSGGTDGRDGPTDAAGGIVSEQTIETAQRNNINVIEALRNNDSYRILDASGGLLMTGPTGTNVADLQIFIRTST